MSKIIKEQVDLDQGFTQQGRRFGYVHGEDGGFFFTWHPTCGETLDSIEADEQDGPGGLTAKEVHDFLLDYLPTTDLARRLWPAEDCN